MDPFWQQLVGNVAATLFGVVSGALVTVWLESRKGRIRRIGEGRLYVELAAIRRGKSGLYIPGEGILAVEDSELVEYRRKYRTVALLCENVTPSDSETPNYVVTGVVPL